MKFSLQMHKNLPFNCTCDIDSNALQYDDDCVFCAADKPYRFERAFMIWVLIHEQRGNITDSNE